MDYAALCKERQQMILASLKPYLASKLSLGNSTIAARAAWLSKTVLTAPTMTLDDMISLSAIGQDVDEFIFSADVRLGVWDKAVAHRAITDMCANRELSVYPDYAQAWVKRVTD
jgi:hypothetical protein